uniref:Immunoglobulin domain-containing protein n=1 Tax=Bos mutus grunniens TaxID=30521 RepID=A0A8B9XPF2_BOSMU
MSVVPPSLLCLGLCLSQSTCAQKGNLPPPRIIALPGSTVPWKSPVTLLYQGPKQAEGYRISRVGSPEPMDKEEQITSRKTNTLNIAEVTTDKTGLYHCSYQRGSHWSQFSDPLQLVITGAYDKPSLSSMAGTVVAPGENVKLQCFSKINHDVFILTKEDGDHVTQNQSSVPQDRGRQAIFLLNPVSSTQAGTYRCYGAFHDNPYVWSQPSDPLQLQVEAPSGNLASQDRRLGIWIGVPVAVGLLLLVFLVFFILYCLHKAKNNAERKERHPEAAGQVNGQASEAADPQEVTYSQVNCHVPHQGTAGTLLGAQTDPEQRVCDAGLQISQAPGPALHLGSRTHSYLW